jgi:hypothetical protein
MKTVFRLTSLLLLFYGVISCSFHKDAPSILGDEQMTEIELLEKAYKMEAFKKTIEVRSDDGVQVMLIQIGSFDSHSFELATSKTSIRLVHAAKAVNAQPQSDFVKSAYKDELDMSKIVFQILEVKNKDLASKYWLQIGFDKISEHERHSRVMGSIPYEVVSHNWPSQAIIGRDPGSQGSVTFNYGQKRRWFNSWDTWGAFPFSLNSPDLRQFSPNDQWRARFTGGYDPGATWLYNFF